MSTAVRGGFRRVESYVSKDPVWLPLDRGCSSLARLVHRSAYKCSALGSSAHGHEPSTFPDIQIA